MADSLEDELGLKIIKRTHTGISLTEEGEYLKEHMIALVEAESSFLNAAKELVKSKENHLRIGTFSSIAQNLLPEIIGRFQKHYPEIKISVSVEDNLHDWLEQNRADIIFTDEYTFGNNVWIPIQEDPFVAVVPSGMLKGKRTVAIEELYDYTYISINEKILESYFDRSKFSSILDFTSIDNNSVLYMVQQGLGFSVLPSLMINKKIEGIRILNLKSPVSRTVGIACQHSSKQSYAAKCFIKHITNTKKAKSN